MYNRFAFVSLPLMVLLFACQSPDGTNGPSAGDEPGGQNTDGGLDQVLARNTPPGLEWYRAHNHAGRSSAPATLSQQLYSSLALTVSEPADLGTSFPSNTASLAMAINAFGQLAGWTAVVTGGGGGSNAVRWDASGTATTLPKITPTGVAGAADINDGGVVVGYDSELDREFGWRTQATRWNPDGSRSNLPLVTGARNQQATGINTSGVAVGWAEVINFDVQAVRWDEQGAHVLPGNHGVAYDINDAGTSVGYVEEPGLRPAVWSASGVLTVLPLPNGDTFGFASGINNLGQVVGAAGVSDGPNFTHHAVVWAADGTATVIPNSEMGEGAKINDAGVVVGYLEDVSSDLRGQTGAIWFKGERMFPPPSPTARTVVNDLSETQLAGGFYPTELHAARWSFSPPRPQFEFTGFFAPVRNPGSSAPYVVNRVKAGQGVPVKFSLHGKQGTNVLAAGYPRSKTVACTLASTQGGETTRSAGGTGLFYSKGADRYNYVWKTDKAWGGTCRQLMVGLTDGSIHTALFRFTK
jgi:uncharacterized membrane protein